MAVLQSAFLPPRAGWHVPPRVPMQGTPLSQYDKQSINSTRYVVQRKTISKLEQGKDITFFISANLQANLIQLLNL